MNKRNVVATAVGLYRMRKKPETDAQQAVRPRRTLFNSEVRDNSWPCVYVFVSEWNEEKRLAETSPADVVPKSLFLPDGRSVPVCVIEARKQPYAHDLQVNVNRLPRNLLGPGSPIVNHDGQGMDRVATAGGIVRDGQRYYLLTNSHASGRPGTVIEALQNHRRPTIGVTSELGITRAPFSTIYPHFPSINSKHLLMDVGLVDLDDITQWKTQFVGLDPKLVENVLDLYDNDLSLRLIGMKVVGNGAVSGPLRGEIHGLFYRFKAIGGAEYLTDFLIGPETYGREVAETTEPAGQNVGFSAHHGDSGTVLLLEHAPPNGTKRSQATHYYPFALLWGKNEFVEEGTRKVHPFALATSLSTTLDRLNLDFVRDLNLDQEFIWGWVGHYAIGSILPDAIKLLSAPKLKQFIDKNIDLLTMTPDASLKNDPRVVLGGDGKHPHFVPLADVPDNTWKSNVNKYKAGPNGNKHWTLGPGARDHAENMNHFADMDLPYKTSTTFLAFNLKNLDTAVDPSVWLDYYASVKPRFDAWDKAIGKTKTAPAGSHWGALPFRVWQLFDAMVASAKSGKQDELLCAGGVLIHYVGDACQPLHTSYLSQGDPDRLVDRPRSPGKKLEADGVHSGYEDEMIDYGYKSKNLMARLGKEVSRQEGVAKERIDDIASGKEAAKALLKLIAATHKTIEPRKIVDKWLQVHTTGPAARQAAMWDEFGDDTIECMARGSRYLAKIWQGAWTAGNGNKKIGAGSARAEDDIMALYNEKTFLPSVPLDKYASILK
jgi:hypothetical protein